MAAAAVVVQDVRRREAGVRGCHADDVGDSARGSAGEHPAQCHRAGKARVLLLCGFEFHSAIVGGVLVAAACVSLFFVWVLLLLLWMVM